MFSWKVIMGSTIYCLLCEFYDVLIRCPLLTLCAYTGGFVCFSDGAILKGLTSKFVWSLHMHFFWFHFCVGIGFMDLSWERMSRVLKSAFAYNGVSLFWSYNPVTNMLLGTPCEIGSASYKFIHITLVLITLWEPYVRSDLYRASKHKCMHAVDMHLCSWRYCGCSCCLCSRDKLSSRALRLQLAASQVLDVSTNAPRVLVATCLGKMFARFELIDLIF